MSSLKDMVSHFTVEESKKNKDHYMLIAHMNDGRRFVVCGDPWNPRFLVPYAEAFDTKEQAKTDKS